MDRIFIGKISKGLEQFYLPFNIDNDAFPTLYNAYAWRGRVKRKRGTATLGRLELQVQLTATPDVWQFNQFPLIAGAGNLLGFSDYASKFPYSATITAISQATEAVVTVAAIPYHLTVGQLVYIENVSGMTEINGSFYEVLGISTGASTITLDVDSTGFTPYSANGNLYVENPIAPGTIDITVGANTYTEPASPDGTLVGSPAGSGTINYATGDITISGGGASNVTGTYAFYPLLPNMGDRDLVISGSDYPSLLSFDTTYAYQITSSSSNFYGINYYKSTNNPVYWTGENYQQFWSTNYQDAFWATNNNPGLYFATIHSCADQVSAAITMVLYDKPLADGGTALTTLLENDYLFFNEGAGTTFTLNLQTGYISDATGSATGTYIVTFPAAQTVNTYTADSCFVQLLTSSVNGSGDGIRWYDGDPTSGTGLPTITTTGWVNFAPPLYSATGSTLVIGDLASNLYYLVGALSIVPFKNRLMFLSPYVQTSAGAYAGTAPVQIADTIVWSWIGTPYYALAPSSQTGNGQAYFVDYTGYGGYLSAGIDQPIISVNPNEDVLLVGFPKRQTRFVYTGNDLLPFLFYSINSELGTESTFSAITLDRGALSMGQYGFALTTQTSAERIDLQIPNQVFQLNASNNAAQRISAVRDFYHEWIQFTFCPNTSAWFFPTQTLQYNYREASWALFYENFTAQGNYRKQEGYTWASNPWNTSSIPWNAINESWSSGTLTSLFPSVIAGTPQGFVLYKSQGTGEAPSGDIAEITSSSGMTQITSVNHCVAEGDYLYFLGGIISGGGDWYLQGEIGQVQSSIDANHFVLDIAYESQTYLGLGTFTRLSQPLIQTKQFPAYWQEGRKVRIATQKYLFDRTDASQVTVNIYLSQDQDNPYTSDNIVPSVESTNNSLVYSNIVYTCPESTNIGLTSYSQSINNPNPIAGSQYQIWHRDNSSLIGDTFQIGITLSDSQMRNLEYATAEIALQAMQFDIARGPLLA